METDALDAVDLELISREAPEKNQLFAENSHPSIEGITVILILQIAAGIILAVLLLTMPLLAFLLAALGGIAWIIYEFREFILPIGFALVCLLAAFLALGGLAIIGKKIAGIFKNSDTNLNNAEIQELRADLASLDEAGPICKWCGSKNLKSAIKCSCGKHLYLKQG